MGQVKFSFVTGKEDISKAYEKIARENVKLRGEIVKTRKAAKDAHDDGKRGAEGQGLAINALAGRMTQLAAGYVSFQAAVNLANAALAEQKRLSSDIANSQLSVAVAEAGLFKMMSGTSVEEREAASAFAMKISRDKKVGNAAEVMNALAGTISATSDVELAKNIVSLAADFSRDSPQDFSSLTDPIGDLALISGAREENELRMLLGGTMAAIGVSRYPRLNAMRQVAPAIGSTALQDSSGDSMNAIREGLALNAAFSVALNDATGEITKTAQRALVDQMGKFLPAEDRIVDEQGNVRKGTGLRTSFERARFLQENPQELIKFMEGTDGWAGASFGQAETVMRDYLSSPDSKTSKMVDERYERIRFDADLVNREAEILRTGGLQPGLVKDRQLKAQYESFTLQSQFADDALIDEHIQNILTQASPDGIFERMFQRSIYGIQRLSGVSATAAALERLEGLESAAEVREREFGETGGSERAYRQEMIERFRNIDSNTRNQADSIPAQQKANSERQ